MRGHAEGELLSELHGRPVFGAHVEQSDPDDMLLFDGSGVGTAVQTLPGAEHQ